MEFAKIMEVVLSVLFFPDFNMFIQYAWGDGNELWLMALKRVFLMLPVLAVILGYWVSILCLLTVLVRADRKAFLNSILVTWWDLGKAIFSFWGGVFKAVFSLTLALFGVVRLVVVGVWVLLHDLLLIPFRIIGNFAQNVLSPGLPWIAIGMTLFWCFLEAVIFTHVCTSLVVDTLSNMTGNQLSEQFIQVPLFLFMSFIILGSYAVLSTWADALRTRDFVSIAKIGIIEGVALFVEVVFLYREFVDALVPWFAQHTSGHFELGVVMTLVIAGVTWVGIRGMTWFLFASSGTPTIMAIISGTGLQRTKTGHTAAMKGSFQLIENLFTQIMAEMDWIHKKGEEVLEAFLLPPLQVIAGAINFCTLLIAKYHMFQLPFRSINAFKIPTSHPKQKNEPEQTTPRKKVA